MGNILARLEGCEGVTHKKYLQKENFMERNEQGQKPSGETMSGLFQGHKEANMAGIQLHFYTIRKKGGILWAGTPSFTPSTSSTPSSKSHFKKDILISNSVPLQSLYLPLVSCLRHLKLNISKTELQTSSFDPFSTLVNGISIQTVAQGPNLSFSFPSHINQ